MHMRRDALQAFCEAAQALPGIIRDHGTKDAVMTVGKVDVKPNFPHTVPGEVLFSLNVRDNERSAMDAMLNAFKVEAQRSCERHGLAMHVDESLGSLDPVKLDPSVINVLVEEAHRQFGTSKSAQVMPSGAGHDAQQMQSICPSGMIFIPSRKGISHSPEEFNPDPNPNPNPNPHWRNLPSGLRSRLGHSFC